MPSLRTYNVEDGLPSLDEARKLVMAQIREAKRGGVRVLKVIHGYGSSGKGGKLCTGLRKSFGLRKKEGVIRDFVAGEDFSIFNNVTLALLEAVPELRRDPDLNATNEGVTVVWLKRVQHESGFFEHVQRRFARCTFHNVRAKNSPI